MRNIHATLAAGACAAFLAGCLLDRSAGASGVGNPTKGTVTVAMVAEDSGAGPAAAAKSAGAGRNPDGSFEIRDAGGTAFTVRSGYANVGRIKIALPEGLDCSDADETECEAGEADLRGPWISDLMTGAWIPDPGAIRLPVGSYRRVGVRLEAQEKVPAGAPDLGRHSLVFGGTFAYAGRTDRPFSIALDFDEEERYESDSGFAVSEGGNTITIALDIAAWLSHTDITACLDRGGLALDPSGGFVLENDGVCGLEEGLKNAIKASGSVHGGHGEDGKR